MKLKRSVDEYYKSAYLNVVNRGAVGFLAKITHASLEKKLNNKKFSTVLELGAGHGQHFNFVKHEFDIYIESDIDMSNLPTRNNELAKIVEQKVLNAQKLSEIKSESIDRIIATCVLIHLQNPEEALKEWKRVVNKNASLISIYVPAEPGILLRILRRITTWRKARKLGFDARYICYTEHKYSYEYIKTIVNTQFEDFEIKWRSFPIPFMPWNLALWKTAQIRLTTKNNC